MGWPQPSFMPESMKVRSYEIDVAIVDIRLPPTHGDEGLQAALQIRAEHPDVGVLVLSQYVELGLALKLLSDSAESVGYLLNDRISEVEDFVGAVRRVAEPLDDSKPASPRRLSPTANSTRPTFARHPPRRADEPPPSSAHTQLRPRRQQDRANHSRPHDREACRGQRQTQRG